MNLDLLRTLTQTFGPSGYEDAIRDAIRAEIADLADEVRVDPLGSLVAYRRGTGGGKKIMLAAHMDEIGFMVTHIEEKGYLRVTPMGGLRTYNHIGNRVRFADGSLGVIHMERRDDPSKVASFPELFVDVGASGRADCPRRVGDPGVFVGPLEQLGNRLISKTLDDRIGCYVLIELLRQLKATPHDLYFAFTTQEEITLSGARTSAYTIDPDIAISVDVTGTGDTPKAHPMAVALGQGPAIKVKDGGMVAHPLVRERLVEAAERAGLPYQMEILLGGTTDAAVMQLTRAGVPSGCVSIPCRFIHSPSEMVDAGDVEQVIQLFLETLTHEF